MRGRLIRVAVLALPVFALIGIAMPAGGRDSPQLEIVRSIEEAGRSVHVTGTGFACARNSSTSAPTTAPAAVTVRFDDDEVKTDPTVPIVDARTGEVGFDLAIPEGTEPGTWGIVVRCNGATARAAVTVTRTITFTVTPDSGHAGAGANVTGRGFDCDVTPKSTTGRMDVYWDGDPVAVTAANDGAFAAALTIPAEAAAGTHEITARCPWTGESAAAGFTVVLVPPPTTPTSTPPPTTTTPTTPSTSSTTTTTPPSIVTPAVRTPARMDPQRAHLSASLATPDDLVPGLLPYVFLLAVAALFALLIGLPIIVFPAEIFNKALEERHERPHSLRWPPSVQLVVFGLLSSLLLVLVEPDAAFDRRTVALAIGLMIAVVLTTLSYCLPGELLHRRTSLRRSVLRTLPVALVIAGVCAVASRVLDFQPGYVYGLIAGYAPIARVLGSSPAERRWHEGRAVLVGALVTLAVSLLAWVLWSLVTVTPGSGFGMLVLDSALGAMALTGIETVLFGLIPMALLDGLVLLVWSRRIWATVYIPTAVAYLVLLMHDRKPATADAFFRAMLLFVCFGLFSMGFWAYVRYRTPRRR